MFERYTERARRVIFFARYEASQLGSVTIETEHLLLGLLREDQQTTNRFLEHFSSIEDIRKEIENRSTLREKVPTSIDLPLSNECKRILAYSWEEAEKLKCNHIGTEHLLLGILRETNCAAARILSEFGFNADTIRAELNRNPVPPELVGLVMVRSPRREGSHQGLPPSGVVPDADTAARIAEAVWIPLCGEETINSQKPFVTELKNNVWIVSGSAVSEAGEHTLFAFILKADGRILSIGCG